MTRTTQITILSILFAATLSLTEVAQAQFSIRGGKINFGGSRRSSSNGNIGRQLQTAVYKTQQTAKQSNTKMTDLRYRGPNPALKPAGKGQFVIGSGRMAVKVDPTNLVKGPGRCRGGNPIIIDDPGYGTPKPCPTVEPAPCPVVEPAPVPDVEKPQPIEERDPALELTYEAQDAFKRQQYTEAAEKMDKVIELSPESAAAYQFRALTYFAKGDYDTAAADVYEMLLRGPIWTWETVRPLYDNQSTYTQQYHALAHAAKDDQESLAKHFTLAYHHLLLGHLEHGEKELQKVLTIQPNEPVTQKLLAVVQDLQTQEAVASR